MKRFAAHGLNGEPAKSAAPALRTPWSTMLHEIAAINDSVALRRSSLRTKFEQNLTGLERTYRTNNDTEGVALVQRALAALSIRRSIEADGFAVTQVVSKNPDWWQDVAREGGYIVGFEVGHGGWFQSSVLGDLKPIFTTMHGLRDGEPRGHAKGERVLAQEGYAVGGLVVCSGAVVNTVKIIFMRINTDGVSLNAQDAYTSDWLGGEGKGLKPVEINPRGHLIIGVTGASSDVVDSLGLIYLK